MGSGKCRESNGHRIATLAWLAITLGAGLAKHSSIASHQRCYGITISDVSSMPIFFSNFFIKKNEITIN
jgi:hypothetical protein